MKILETRVSDTGLYVCVASNIAGNLTQYVELSVLGNLKLFTFLMYVIIPACLNLFACLFDCYVTVWYDRWEQNR